MTSRLKRIFRGNKEEDEDAPPEGTAPAAGPPQSRRFFGSSRKSSFSDKQSPQLGRQQTQPSRPRSLIGPSHTSDYHEAPSKSQRPQTAETNLRSDRPNDFRIVPSTSRQPYTHLDQPTIRPVSSDPPYAALDHTRPSSKYSTEPPRSRQQYQQTGQGLFGQSPEHSNPISTQTTTTTTTTTHVPSRQQGQNPRANHESFGQAVRHPNYSESLRQQSSHKNIQRATINNGGFDEHGSPAPVSAVTKSTTTPLEHNFQGLSLKEQSTKPEETSTIQAQPSRSNSIARKPIGLTASARSVGGGTMNSTTEDARVQQDSGIQSPFRHHRHSGQDSSSFHARQTSLSPKGKGISPEEVLARAKTNSADTTVAEIVAPAVTHETIKEHVHEIRNEVTTREVHNHEYYHRILPIIDVEVLPTRHFLPVAGGGLVEVNPEDVPGRGRNWIIAETASTIPSDPEPNLPEFQPRQFTARTFAAHEGDFKRYITPEGFERTEQTWVHHPEIETGGYLSKQTWPMEFLDAASKTNKV